MPLTPLEIRNKEFRKAFRGYDEEEVDEFLDQVIESYEQLYKENINLKESLDTKDSNMNHYRDLEDTLKQTLVVAQQAADETKQNAVKEAQNLTKQAQMEATQKINIAEEKARNIIDEAKSKANNIRREYEEIQQQLGVFKVKFRTFLESQLKLIEDENKDLFGETGIYMRNDKDIFQAEREVAVAGDLIKQQTESVESDEESLKYQSNNEDKGILNKEVIF